MMGHVSVSIYKVKTGALVNVRKNSAKLTEPMVVGGSIPELIRVEVATGPQPPPPVASTNLSNNASFPTYFGACVRRRGGRNALLRIYIPRSNR